MARVKLTSKYIVILYSLLAFPYSLSFFLSTRSTSLCVGLILCAAENRGAEGRIGNKLTEEGTGSTSPQ